MTEIKHDNIIYVHTICPIGGVETYVYELVRKYKDYDIAVVCKIIDPAQKRRLKKYCPVYIHKNEPINCKVIITNFDTSIIEYVNKEAKVYTGIHSDYSHRTQLGAFPKDDPRITYICITEDSKKKFEDLSGIKDRTILCRNPLYLEETKKPMILVSATRLTPEKGGERMYELAKELDRQGIDYVWYIFTTNNYPHDPIWLNKNVVRMNPRLDLDYFYKQADWVVQLSECEGDSYTLKEALYRGTPLVVCELPYFKEYDITDNKNSLFLELDCSNVSDVVERMKKPLKFTFKHIDDNYDEIIVKGKSHYKEELEMKYKVKAIIKFEDVAENVTREIGDEFVVMSERKDYLLDHNAIQVIEEIKEEKPVIKKTTRKKKI